VRTLHVGLSVADLERSLAFYTSLGYDVLGEVPATELGRLTMLKLPDDEFVSLELVDGPSAGKIDPGGLGHLVVKVERLHDTERGQVRHGELAACRRQHLREPGLAARSVRGVAGRHAPRTGLATADRR
jgi:catechol 2,3-dioxygenase-like lactoylglutathione lyase family enzyme